MEEIKNKAGKINKILFIGVIILVILTIVILAIIIFYINNVHQDNLDFENYLKNTDYKSSSSYFECLNKTSLPKNFIPGVIYIKINKDFQQKNLDYLIKKYLLENITIKPNSVGFSTLKVQAGTEKEWICRFKEEKIVEEASVLVIK